MLGKSLPSTIRFGRLGHRLAVASTGLLVPVVLGLHFGRRGNTLPSQLAQFGHYRPRYLASLDNELADFLKGDVAVVPVHTVKEHKGSRSMVSLIFSLGAIGR